MENKNKLSKKILVEDYKEQPFEWKTKKYGCAEFILCPIIKRNKIRAIYLYPAQQPNAKHYYVIKNDHGWEGIHFGSLLIEGKRKNTIQQPTIWTTHFCEKHKTHSFSFYVPRKARSFFITNGLGKFCLNWR